MEAAESDKRQARHDLVTRVAHLIHRKVGHVEDHDEAGGCWRAAEEILGMVEDAHSGDPVTSDLTLMRAADWSVAVHNDYRQGGEPRTFWLFTHPDGRWVKGEARTDLEAISEAAVHAGVLRRDEPKPGGPEWPPTPLGLEPLKSWLLENVGSGPSPAWHYFHYAAEWFNRRLGSKR